MGWDGTNKIFSPSKRTNKTKSRASSFSRDESNSFGRKVLSNKWKTEVVGVRVIVRKIGTGERVRARSGAERNAASKRVRQAKTSCYILEEHSNSDMKREARGVNEDPRGNASGTRSGRGEEQYISTAYSGDANEREKERDKR